MAKKGDRIVNTQNFLPDDASVAASRKRSKAPKTHQQQEKLISSITSRKILKEALAQQREVEDEENADKNPSSAAFAVAAAAAEEWQRAREEEGDIDAFNGFTEGDSDYNDYQKVCHEEIDEIQEKLLMTFISKTAATDRTLTDIILEKLKEKNDHLASEARPMPKLDASVIELYKGVGKLLSEYTQGKMPKAFKHITSMACWEDVLYLTEPEKWSANAMYQATRIFASNFSSRKVERFYKLVLLPRVRVDIRKHRRLHFALYQSLKKALYKPAAFNKGILLPLAKSGTCSLREAVIVGSIIEKSSIPMLHSSVALLKLAEMEYCGTTSYFIKVLLEKKYALPYRVLDAVVANFMRFLDDVRAMPVIWHQSLLAFVQRYKHELQKEDKENLQALLEKQYHRLVTPGIERELENSRNRGEKEVDTVPTVSVVNKPIEEDRFDIPQVPMEEDD
ncbi:PREDICTED: bystin [Tarenaya hassleriana]|uniref:bystin n=1 Tax=Tarenaya hassleriana TaxID=28532 RepID=UPI00053C73E0|nr:PREDICTED: bystin [Tarenaya hassleriana]